MQKRSAVDMAMPYLLLRQVVSQPHNHKIIWTHVRGKPGLEISVLISKEQKSFPSAVKFCFPCVFTSEVPSQQLVRLKLLLLMDDSLYTLLRLQALKSLSTPRGVVSERLVQGSGRDVRPWGAHCHTNTHIQLRLEPLGHYMTNKRAT